MIEMNGKQVPSSCEEANELAEAIEGPIEAARDRVSQAKEELLETCIKAYPVGTLVQVNVAARRNPVHEVISVNEYGWLTLKNSQTGTERGMLADSNLIRPSRCWYKKTEKNS
jgi:hypothetical protein